MTYKSYLPLVFISTFIDRIKIDDLIDSVLSNNYTIHVLFIIINQTKTELILSNSIFIEFIQINTELISLSKARNMGIDYLIENDIKFSHIMFPDDDSTFSESFFSIYTAQIEKNSNYLIDVYSEGTVVLFKKNKYSHGDILSQDNFDAAMSVNMIVNYRTFSAVGFYDERIGVGAKYGAGEDTDYFIRACKFAKKGFIYNKMLFNFHPSSSNKFSTMQMFQIVKKYVNYGNGVVFMLCKHKMYFNAIYTCFKAIGGAIVSLFKLDIKLFVAFSVAFFSRTIMFIKCLIFAKQIYKNA